MKRKAPRPPLAVTVEPSGFGVRVTASECCPSINQITSMVPMQRAREARRWVAAVSSACLSAGLKLEPPVRITATYVWGNRIRRDLWNYPPKWAVDGLVMGGLIPDDNAECVSDCSIAFGFAPGRPSYLTLELESMAPVDGGCHHGA